MKNSPLLMTICCLFFFTAYIQSQNSTNSSILNSQDQQISAADYFTQEYKTLGISSAEDMKLETTNDVKNGWKHYKYQQQYKGLEVLTAVYILHEKEGLVRGANGRTLSNINMDINPAITISSAEEIAENAILLDLISQNKISISDYSDFIPKTNNQKLCIADKAYPNVSGEYALVWVFDMDHQSWPPHNDRYVVDAHNGEILSNISLIHQESIEVEVATKYYGNKKIMLDSLGPNQYVLRDDTRGKGIFTVDGFDGELYHSNDKTDWIKHEEEYETATDVHFCMEEFYDFLLEKFNWRSIDNKDFELRSIIHTRPEASYVNAFWNGREANFGDGNCNDYSPLTTLDVVGHEFTHGLTQNTSGLIYRGESGGLNESISDILGKMLEYYAAPSQFSWDLGPAFIKNPDASIFRSMSDPHKSNNPKYYNGINWFDEVHNTSGVLNFWFYLISDGEKATNEKGLDYDVVAIGKEKALQIVFSMETNYLTPSSNYRAAVDASIAATTELYGDSGAEMAAVLEAWNAVGLAAVVLSDFDLKISITDPIAGGPSLCPVGNLGVSVEIENIGNNTMNKGMELPLVLTQDGNVVSEATIELDNDLATGEFITYQFEDSASIEGFSKFRTNLEASMTIKDDNPINDKSLVVVDILRSNVPGKDLSMQSILGLRGGICIDEDKAMVEIAYLALVKNVGCDVIELGTEIGMDLTIDGNTQKYSVPMPVHLLPGISQFLTVTFDAEISAGELELLITLDNVWDVRDANDERSFKRFVGQKIDETYNEEFSNFEVADEKHIAFAGGNMAYSKVELNNNEMLGFSTRRNVNIDRLEDCDMVKRFFNSNQKTGNITWCVDVNEKLETPAFEFDMVQFTSTQASFPADRGYQSMAVLSIPGDASFEKQYYYGQNQGEIVHHQVPLAKGFSGSLRMDFFTAYGTANRLKNGEFDKIDAILLDNIMITDEMVSIEKPLENTYISVYPNPAFDFVSFNLVSEINRQNTRVQVYDMMGREIHTNEFPAGDTYRWNTSDLQSGIYLYEILNDGVNIGSGRIVVGK